MLFKKDEYSNDDLGKSEKENERNDMVIVYKIGGKILSNRTEITIRNKLDKST